MIDAADQIPDNRRVRAGLEVGEDLADDQFNILFGQGSARWGLDPNPSGQYPRSESEYHG
jgi:hypothetical protein